MDAIGCCFDVLIVVLCFSDFCFVCFQSRGITKELGVFEVRKER